MTSPTLSTSRASLALGLSPIPALRKLSLEETEDIVLITGSVSSYYLKQLAQEMGYVPDSTAQGLRTRTTKLFGMVIPSLANPIYSRVILAIQERAYSLGYDVLLAYSLNLPDREETSPL